MDSLDEELDDTWIEDFFSMEKNYNKFYKEPCKYIDIFFIYVNNENKIELLKKNNINLNNSKIDKEKIIYLIKNNQTINNKYYKLISLLKYNPTIEPELVINGSFENDGSQYLKSERYLNDIYFDDTIDLFQDLNSLFLIFYINKSNQKKTKRILLHTKARKTKKKKLKADNI